MKNKSNEIKAIAFDLGGVLMKENEYKLSSKTELIEKQLDRVDQDNKLSENEVKESVDEIINNLYELRDPDIFNKLPKLKFAIASNHLVSINNWIDKIGINKYLYCTVISADIGVSKPDSRFYKILAEKLEEKPKNILFVDDLAVNIEGAKKLGFSSLHYNSSRDLAEEVLKKI